MKILGKERLTSELIAMLPLILQTVIKTYALEGMSFDCLLSLNLGRHPVMLLIKILDSLKNTTILDSVSEKNDKRDEVWSSDMNSVTVTYVYTDKRKKVRLLSLSGFANGDFVVVTLDPDGSVTFKKGANKESYHYKLNIDPSMAISGLTCNYLDGKNRFDVRYTYDSLCRVTGIIERRDRYLFIYPEGGGIGTVMMVTSLHDEKACLSTGFIIYIRKLMIPPFMYDSATGSLHPVAMKAYVLNKCSCVRTNSSPEYFTASISETQIFEDGTLTDFNKRIKL